jgi:hypothetical protein
VNTESGVFLLYLVRVVSIVKKLGDGFLESVGGEAPAVVLVVAEVLSGVDVKHLHATQPEKTYLTYYLHW